MLSETILLILIMPMFVSKMVNAVCHEMTKNGLKWSFYGILSYMAYDILSTNIDMMGIEKTISDSNIEI